MNRVFSGAVSFSRVNPFGLALMAAAVLMVILAGKIACKFRPALRDKAEHAIKITALVICAGGALLAILG